MNIFRLGSTVDASRLPQGETFTALLARITGSDPVQSYFAMPNIEMGANPIGNVWCVNLTGWAAPAAPPPATSPARNRLSMTNCRASIQLQSDGASELLVVDYPASGTSFCVAGQSIDVNVTGLTPAGGGPNPKVAPILGAYLSPPAGVTGVGAGPGRCATFTTDAQPTATGAGPFSFDVPVRARGYVPLYHAISPVNGSFGFAAQQLIPGLNTLCDNLFVIPGNSEVIALHPLAQTLLVVPLGGNPGDQGTLAIMWILQTCQ